MEGRNKAILSIAHLSEFMCSAASDSTNSARYSSTRVADNRTKKRINNEDLARTAYQCLISFVWLRETSCELAPKKVGFHKIMQTAVKLFSLILC